MTVSGIKSQSKGMSSFNENRIALAMTETSPIRPTDDEARALAKSLLVEAKHAALGTIDPKTNMPMVTRIAIGTTPEDLPLSLVSDLSAHTDALRKNAAASLLVGEPGPKGDPLTHPRLTLQANARFVVRKSEAHILLRQHYLKCHPKSQLYIDFTDFNFVIFDVVAAYLNGGFGKAYILTADDMIGP